MDEAYAWDWFQDREKGLQRLCEEQLEEIQYLRNFSFSFCLPHAHNLQFNLQLLPFSNQNRELSIQIITSFVILEV